VNPSKPASARVRTIAPALLLFTAACYGAEFTPTGTPYTPHAEFPEMVKVTTEHPAPGFVEVGLLSGSGASFEGALKRIKEEAAEQGCEVVLILGEAIQSGYGTPGAAYGMTKNHVRAACFVELSTTARAGNGANAKSAALAPDNDSNVEAATTSAPLMCTPDCRQGFDCIRGQCVSACNPACPDGQSCVGHGGAATCATPGTQAGAPSGR
jgi:hypothetical protein